MQEEIYIGVAQADIVPPFSLFMGGYAARGNKHFEDIYDSPSAGIVSLRQGKRKVMIVRADLSAMDANIIQEVSEKLEEKYQIPQDCILFNVSHTHSAPLGSPMDSILLTDEDHKLYRKFVSFLIDRLLQISNKAIKDEEPCSIYLAKTSFDLGLNRRKKIGQEIRNAPEKNGFIDNDLPLVVIKNRQHNIKSIIFSCACHPVTLGSGNFKLSADFPGYAAAYIQRHLDCTTFFLQGCGGDIRPKILENGDCWRKGTLDDLEIQGKKLGQTVIKALSGKMEKLYPCINSIKSAFALKYEKKMSVDDYEMVLNDPQSNLIKKKWAANMKKLLKKGLKSQAKHHFILQKISLSENTHIFAMSGEVVAEIGKKIKNLAPNMNIITLGYSHASSCYIPSKKMFSEGGYEVESYYHFSLPGKLSSDTEDIIINSCKNLFTQSNKFIYKN